MFKVPQNDQLMADAIADYMAKHGVKTVGFIGFADAYGDSWYNTFNAAAANRLKVVSNERYNRTDASVMGQVLKLMGSTPDAVLIAGSGTPAALPAKTLKERGYKGKCTRRMASRTTTSCACAARIAKARSCRPARARDRPAARFEPGEEAGARLQGGVREGLRRGFAVDLRRPRMGRRVAAAARDSGGAERAAGHRSVPRGAARVARE
jgi:hypothetical protein